MQHQNAIKDALAENPITAICPFLSGFSECGIPNAPTPCPPFTVSDATESVQKRLFAWQRGELARITLAECTGRISTPESVAELSKLAETALLAVITYATEVLEARFGAPMNAGGARQTLMVLALGKLGGSELNFFSDLDVVFLYLDEGETAAGAGQRRIANQDFFARTAQLILRIMAAGPIYNMDLRLRPFGAASQLVIGFEALEQYLQVHARDWERFAYAKARLLNGEPAARAAVEKLINAFVYRRYTDYGLLESMREMHRMITHEVTRQQLHHNIKRGRGGIREVEFSLQVLQILFAGRNPHLKVRGSFALLKELRGASFIEGTVRAELQADLAFLRAVENRLQMWQCQQTHDVPEHTDDARWAFLAATIRLTDGKKPASIATLKTHINTVRKRVHAHFLTVLHDGTEPSERSIPSGRSVPATSTHQTFLDIERLLAPLAEKDADTANIFEAALTAFLHSRQAQLATQRAHNRLNVLLPNIIAYLVGYDDEDTVNIKHPDNPDWARFIDRLFALLKSIIRRSVYISLLNENDRILQEILAWCHHGDWLLRQITAYPPMLEEVIGMQRRALGKRDLALQAARRFSYKAPEEAQLNALRKFARANRLKVAAFDLQGAIGVYQASDALTLIARETVRMALSIALNSLKAEWADKVPFDIARAPFIIIGYGKVGSSEMSYESDVDVVMMYGDPPDDMDSAKRALWVAFFQRLARKWLQVMSAPTLSGIAYTVDARLRPDGASGPLMSSFSQYKRYLEARAWTWERQALLKARAIAGDARLASSFGLLRRAVLSEDIPTAKLRDEIVNMRAKMRHEHRRQIGIKYALGGILDIEFMVQYLALRYAPMNPALLRSRSVWGILQNFLHSGSDVVDVGWQEAYFAFRSYQHRCTLTGEREGNGEAFVRLDEQRAYIQAEWRRVFGEGG